MSDMPRLRAYQRGYEQGRATVLDSQMSELLSALAERNIHSRRDLLAALAERDAEVERMRAVLGKMLLWAAFVWMYDRAVREHDQAEARAPAEEPKP